MLNRRGGGKEPSRVERGIAEVLVGGAVELIRPRLENVIPYALSLELSLGAAGLDLKLLHSLHEIPNER